MADGNNIPFPEPYPENVPGPFYVGDGCCTACDLPIEIAPDLFAYTPRLIRPRHCFVQKQPTTADELTRMLRVVWGAETECVYYRGSDTDTLRRLAELDRSFCSEIPPPSQFQTVYRNHVSFELSEAATSRTAENLAEACRRYLLTERGNQCTPIQSWPGAASFHFSWYADNFYELRFEQWCETDANWHLFHPLPPLIGTRGVIFTIWDWLETLPGVTHARWYSEEDWHGSREYQTTPW